MKNHRRAVLALIALAALQSAAFAADVKQDHMKVQPPLLPIGQTPSAALYKAVEGIPPPSLLPESLRAGDMKDGYPAAQAPAGESPLANLGKLEQTAGEPLPPAVEQFKDNPAALRSEPAVPEAHGTVVGPNETSVKAGEPRRMSLGIPSGMTAEIEARRSKERVGLNDTVLSALMKMSDGNPGAAVVLNKIMAASGPVGLMQILHLDSQGIYGPDIWLGFKDVSGEKIDVFLHKLRAGTLKQEIEKFKGGFRQPAKPAPQGVSHPTVGAQHPTVGARHPTSGAGHPTGKWRTY